MSSISIYDLASSGTLSQSDLVGRDKDILAVNKSTDLAPLGVAVLHGHKKVVKLLLDHGANAKGGPDERLPLWVAAARTRGYIGGIVELLLNHGADPKDKCALNKNSTPLLALVKRYRNKDDLDVIEALMNAGADPTMINDEGESARSVAERRKNRRVLDLLISPEKRSNKFIKHLLMLGAIIIFTIAWANLHSPHAKMVAVAATATAITTLLGPIEKRFKMKGFFSKLIPQEISQRLQEDATAKEFKNDMQEYITKARLDRFFEDKEFLRHVVERAVELEADPATLLDVHDLAHLALYQPVLYCDDSQSMNKEQRKDTQVTISERITSLTTCIVPADTGIELRFINRRTEPQMSNPSTEMVKSILQTTAYNGWTEIGTNFKTKVLEEIVYRPIRDGTLERPVLISILTDGQPGGPSGSKEKRDTLKEAIIECGEFLKENQYEPNVVRFQISQIGHDEGSESFIRELASDRSLEDVLYCTSQHLDDEFRKLRENEHRLDQWILNLLLEPIRNADSK